MQGQNIPGLPALAFTVTLNTKSIRFKFQEEILLTKIENIAEKTQVPF